MISSLPIAGGGPHLDIDADFLGGVPVKLTCVEGARLLLHIEDPIGERDVHLERGKK